MNNQYASAHPISLRVFRPWAERVALVTEGRVHVEIYDDSALGPPQLMIDDCLNGVMDIALLVSTYYPNQLVLSGLFDLPMVADGSAEKSSVVLWDMLQTEPALRQEFAGFEILWAFMNPPYQFHSSKRPVKTLSDLRDSKLATVGVLPFRVALLLDLHAESVTMPMITNSLELGLADSCFLPYAPLRSQGMADYVKYHTDVDLMANSFYVVVNKDVWDRIDARDRKAIQDISGRSLARRTGKVFDDYTADDTLFLRQRGDEFVRLSEAEMAALRVRLNPLHDDWIRRANHPESRVLLEKAKGAMREPLKEQ